MRCHNLKLIEFNNRCIGLEGDCIFHYAEDFDLKIVIGICPELHLTLQTITVENFFKEAHDAILNFASDLLLEKDIQKWALINSIEIRHIPNFLSMRRTRPKLPVLVFIEEERLDDLERTVRQ